MQTIQRQDREKNVKSIFNNEFRLATKAHTHTSNGAKLRKRFFANGVFIDGKKMAINKFAMRNRFQVIKIQLRYRNIWFTMFGYSDITNNIRNSSFSPLISYPYLPMLLNQGHSCFYSNFKCREIKSANKLFFWWNRIQIRNLLITYHHLRKKPAIFNLRKNCRKFVLFHHSLKCSTRKFEFNWNLRKNRHFSTVLFQSVNNHKLIGFFLILFLSFPWVWVLVWVWV